MSWTETEGLQDAYESKVGREIDLGCTECGESRVVHVHEGECLSDDRVRCPTSGCNGEGVEL